MLEQINKIYKELTYNDLNGGSIVISVLLAIIFIGLIVYFYIQINIKLLRKDWPLNRCNPLIMPFAGLIMPQSTQSAWEYTEANFSYCSMSILRKLATIATIPIHLMEEAILKLEKLILESIFALIRLMNLITKYIKALLKSLFNKLQNILIIQLQNGLVLSDIMHRVSGIMTTQYYVSVSMWNTFGSAMNSMWLNILTFFSILFAAEYATAGVVAAMVGVAMIAFAIPFTAWAGPPLMFAAGAAGIVGLAALVATIFICMLTLWIGPLINLVFDTHTPLLIPGDPTFFWRETKLCFAKNTIIPTLHNGSIPIQHLTPGTILSDQSIVTATMILDSTGQDAYFLDSTIVTGSHKVLYQTNWIYVKDHPDAISLPPLNDPIYCFNTTNKTIQLHNTTYSDWDDIEEKDLITLHNTCEMANLSEPLVFENIHMYLEVGFHPDTTFEMKDGTNKHIAKIQLGEILAQGEIVMGCVTIQGDVPLYYHEKDVIGTANVQVDNAPIGPYTGTVDTLYHLLTNTGTIQRNNMLWKDYNDGLERFFE